MLLLLQSRQTIRRKLMKKRETRIRRKQTLPRYLHPPRELIFKSFSLRPNDKLTLYWDVSKEVFVIYHLVVVVGGGGVRLNHRTQKRLTCFLGGEVIRLSRKIVGRGVVNVFSSHVDLNATSAKYDFIRNFIEVPSNNFFISSRMTRSQIFFKLSFSTFLPSDKSSRAKSLEPYR